MNLLSSKTHGVLDYIVALLLLILPWILGFSHLGLPSLIFYVLGVATFLYSIITDYEHGIVRLLPFSVHLKIDLASGLLLAASPWIFGFWDRIYSPHLLTGLCEIIAVFITRPSHGFLNKRHDRSVITPLK